MSLTEMIAKLDELTAAERRALVEEVVRRDMTNGSKIEPHTPPPADAPAWAPKLSKEEFARQLWELGPMSDETYAAYQQALAWSGEIHEDDWK